MAQREVAAIDSQARTKREPESARARIALAVPGFGGFAWDTTNGDLLVWVKDLNRGQAARAAVAEFLAQNAPGSGGKKGPSAPVRLMRGDYDYLELGSIRDRISAALEKQHGLLGIGINEYTNGVSVVAAAGAVARLKETLTGAGVPASAVRFQAVDVPWVMDAYDPNDPTTYPPHFDDVPFDTVMGSAAPTYLDSRHAAVRGGARISYYVPVPDPTFGTILEAAGCTAGPIVKDYENNLRMLTASHCSRQWGGTDPLSSYYQPYPLPRTDKRVPSPEVPFAFEFFDHNWRTQLPSMVGFKMADVLMETVPSSGARVGDFAKIHRPATSTNAWFIPVGNPRYQIDATTPAFSVIGTAVAAFGDRVDKVGASTGWTHGTVQELCYDVNYPTRLPSGATLWRSIRCTTKTSTPGWRGDSGAPFFKIVGPSSNSQVHIVGTLTGGADLTYSTYSPVSRIEMELGPITYH